MHPMFCVPGCGWGGLERILFPWTGRVKYNEQQYHPVTQPNVGLSFYNKNYNFSCHSM